MVYLTAAMTDLFHLTPTASAAAVKLALIVISLTTASAAQADGPPRVGISLGAGMLHFEETGSEMTVALRARARVHPYFAIDFGRDSVETSFPCGPVGFCGFYASGMSGYLIDGAFAPYLFGRLSYLLATAETEHPHVYNVGPHYAGGAGVEWTHDWLGAYLELGILGDFAGEFVAATATGGIIVWFGPWD